MKIVQALVGARAADSLPFSNAGTPLIAEKLAEAEYDFLAGYLGAMNPSRLQALLSSGVGYSPVTFGGEYEDGAEDEIAQLHALGIPTYAPGSVGGVTVWLDMEGMKAFKTDPVRLIGMINAWADRVAAAGYMPGLYVGVPQPLTSDELWSLRVKRYWKGQGSVRDRKNQLAEPTGCGWCMTQMYPSIPRGGIMIDANIVGQDFKGRVPNIVVA